MTRFLQAIRFLITTIVVAALTLVSTPALPTQAAGLVNCVDVTGKLVGRVGCYEYVWVNGVQQRMTFANQGLPGAKPADGVSSFYLIAQQTATPQGTLPFAHDHTVPAAPQQNGGDYTVLLRGYIALCSAKGITSGGCVPTMVDYPGLGTLPLAKTANGHMLTSADAIESAANAGLITLVDSGSVLVATLGPTK